MNYTQIAGHVGKDPETRFTPSGQKVISFSVATNRKKKGQEETVWYRVTLWGDQFDNLLPYIKKGSSLIIIGDLEVRTYLDKEGKTQVSLELTGWKVGFSPFGKSGGTQDGASRESQGNQQGGQQSYGNEYASEPMRGSYNSSQPAMNSSLSDEEIPF